MLPLSAVFIVRDEAADIGRALDAVGFAAERLVVDSGSTDATVAICRARGARVLTRPFDGFGPQKRWAVSQAAHDWVLCLDADEEVTPELRQAIEHLMASEPGRPAYILPFRTSFLGRALSRGAMAREAHVRLFDRRRARWSEAPIHERVEVDGAPGRLAGFVRHDTCRDLSESLGKLDRYTTAGALELRRRGKLRGPIGILLTGHFQFFRHWILKGNILNGLPGLAWSVLQAVSPMVKHLKAHERERDR